MVGMGLSFEMDKNEWEWMGTLKVEFWKVRENNVIKHKNSLSLNATS